MTSQHLGISLLGLPPLILWTAGICAVAPSTEKLHNFWHPESPAFPSERLPLSSQYYAPLVCLETTQCRRLHFPAFLAIRCGSPQMWLNQMHAATWLVLRHQICLLTHIPFSLLMGGSQGVCRISHLHRLFLAPSTNLKGTVLYCSVLPKLCKLQVPQNPDVYTLMRDPATSTMEKQKNLAYLKVWKTRIKIHYLLFIIRKGCFHFLLFQHLAWCSKVLIR